MRNIMRATAQNIGGKACRIFLFLAVFATTLGAQPVLAQEGDPVELRLVGNTPRGVEIEPGKENKLFLAILNKRNDSLTDIALSSDTADGWIIRFEPSEIDSIIPDGIDTVEVFVSPPPGVVRGEHSINVNLIARGQGIRNVKNFTVTVAVASLSLTLLGPDRFSFRTDVRAGQDNAFSIEVTNIGNKDATDIRLSADAAGWLFSFDPSRIDALPPGGRAIVDVNVRPPAKATTEDTEVRFIAEADETRETVSFFFSAKPAQVWTWVWIAIGVAVVALFVFIYMKYGRQ
jgi:uncharacterized membrane protein